MPTKRKPAPTIETIVLGLEAAAGTLRNVAETIHETQETQAIAGDVREAIKQVRASLRQLERDVGTVVKSQLPPVRRSYGRPSRQPSLDDVAMGESWKERIKGSG